MGSFIFILSCGLILFAGWAAVGLLIGLTLGLFKLTWFTLKLAAGIVLLPLKILAGLVIAASLAALVAMTIGTPILLATLGLLVPLLLLIALPVCLLRALWPG